MYNPHKEYNFHDFPHATFSYGQLTKLQCFEMGIKYIKVELSADDNQATYPAADPGGGGIGGTCTPPPPPPPPFSAQAFLPPEWSVSYSRLSRLHRVTSYCLRCNLRRLALSGSISKIHNVFLAGNDLYPRYFYLMPTMFYLMLLSEPRASIALHVEDDRACKLWQPPAIYRHANSQGSVTFFDVQNQHPLAQTPQPPL